MQKTTTACCALCQINSVDDYTTITQLKNATKILHRQMLDNKEVGITTGNGQTAVFVIVSPGEKILEKNLQSLGFANKHSFERRIGYPKTGDLKMYIKNL